MKQITNIFLIASLFFLMVACNNQPAENKVEATEPAETEEATETMAEETASTAKVYDLAVGQSMINWKGTKKLVEKEHVGTINFSQGYVEAGGNNITGGEFVVDMNSIKNKDMEGTEGAAKLERHLKSADFFEVETYPAATFEIVSAAPYEGEGDQTHEVTGNLTMKGITKEITFPATVMFEGNQVKADASFTIDRAEWNVQYGSESFFPDLIKKGQDAIISDEVELTLDLYGQKTPG